MVLYCLPQNLFNSIFNDTNKSVATVKKIKNDKFISIGNCMPPLPHLIAKPKRQKDLYICIAFSFEDKFSKSA
jgi:hypothetical protein